MGSPQHPAAPARSMDDFFQEAYDETSSSSRGRFKYYLAFFALGIANTGDATEIGCMNFVLSDPTFQSEMLQNDLRGKGAALTCAIFGGMLVGGLATGAMGDHHYGRKPMTLWGLAVNSIFGMLAALAPNLTIMALARFGAGIGIGAILSSLIAFSTEISPPNQRGLYVSAVAGFWTVGSIFCAATALFMFEVTSSSWRSFMITCSTPAQIGYVLVFCFVPESPRFLALHGRWDQAVANANWYAIHGMGYQGMPLTVKELKRYNRKTSTIGISIDSSDDESTLSIVEKVSIQQNWDQSSQNLKALFQSSTWFVTLPLLLLWACMSFGSGLGTWLNTIFIELGMPNAYTASLFFALANIPGNIASTLYLDKLGRKTMQVLSMGCAAISLIFFAYGASTFRPEDGAWFYILIVGSACVYHSFLVVGWTTLSCMTGESFPTSLRSTGMGLCAAAGRLSAMGVQFVNGALYDTPALLLSFASICMFVGACIPLLIKMTDHSQQPLQDRTKAAADLDAVMSKMELELTTEIQPTSVVDAKLTKRPAPSQQSQRRMV